MDAFVQALVAGGERSAELVMGSVVEVNATTLTVLIRGTATPTAYLPTYKPALGDLVAVLRQDATILALGSPAGAGGNRVANFSFEQGGVTAETPDQWHLFNAAGDGTASGVETGYAPAGIIEMVVSGSDTAADTYVYSNPIGVVEGETWALSALAAGIYQPGAIPDATAGVYALWFANTADAYPTVAAPNTLAAEVVDLVDAPSHASISGTVTVPPAASFMRVAVRSQLSAGSSIAWDTVIGRKVA